MVTCDERIKVFFVSRGLHVVKMFLVVFLFSRCLCWSGCFPGVWWSGGFPDVSVGLKVFQVYLVGWLFSRCLGGLTLF